MRIAVNLSPLSYLYPFAPNMKIVGSRLCHDRLQWNTKIVYPWNCIDGRIAISPTLNSGIHGKRSENRMRQARFAWTLLALAAVTIRAQDAVSAGRPVHQAPDKDGMYYAGPEVTAPRLDRTVFVTYPLDVPEKDFQGMTVLAMVIGTDGIPAHIQILHSHGDEFDRASIAAVKHSVFEPGRLAGKPVPVWIDVRVIFRADRRPAIPEVLITERDLPLPDESYFNDKHHNPLSYTAPIPIHTVDADFVDPFIKHPYVQEAVVSVLVGEDGSPKEVRVVRGLAFGLDKKAEAAVWHYRFYPATSKGKPIAARREVMVDFTKF
jgi:TonB family protein